MKHIKTNFHKIKPSGVRQLGINVHTALTGNAFVTTPNPTLVALQTAITNSVNANNAHEAGKDTLVALKEARDAADRALEDALRTEANTCEVACGGDAVKLATTGFELRATPSPVGTPEQVTDLKMRASESDGAFDVSWKNVRGAGSYEIQSSPDPIGTWTPKAIVTTTRGVHVNSFTSGERIWMRVRAIGAGGEGAWSDPAVKTAP